MNNEYIKIYESLDELEDMAVDIKDNINDAKEYIAEANTSLYYLEQSIKSMKEHFKVQ